MDIGKTLSVSLHGTTDNSRFVRVGWDMEWKEGGVSFLCFGSEQGALVAVLLGVFAENTKRHEISKRKKRASGCQAASS